MIELNVERINFTIDAMWRWARVFAAMRRIDVAARPSWLLARIGSVQTERRN